MSLDRADVVVVGAGAAGALLAARLSEDPARRVILLEAGGRGANPLLRVPLMTGILLRSRLANWSYMTEPEPGLGGRVISIPRGKVLGGSTAINGMVWARGRPSDFDAWAQSGLTGWNWNAALAGYRQIERFQGGESDDHGSAGALPITDAAVSHPLLDAFVAAGRQAGYSATADFNAPPYEGVGRYHFSIAGGRRFSTAHAFLASAADRANLHIVTRAQARRVVISGRRAIGVEAQVGGAMRRFLAGEIVICGGAINSPQLLMLSGIGPADHLARHGIEVQADLPGVGANLHDHVLVRVEHACTQPITLQSLTRLDRAGFALLRALITGTGPAASFPLAAGFMLRSDPSLEEPDLQSHFLPGLTTATLRVPFLAGPMRHDDGHGFMANVTQMRPESRGSVRLASADPLAAPRICPNYLTDPRDRAVLRRGVRLLREIFAQSAFDPYRGAELSPGLAVQSDAALDDWISHTADTVHHAVGTCRLGADHDAGAVVDERLRVRGIEKLRVADASVMPRITSGNTAAPSMLIGHRCADFMTGLG
jgi:choline dehydrogenase